MLESISLSFSKFFSETGFIGYVIVVVITFTTIEIGIWANQLGIYFGDLFYYWIFDSTPQTLIN